eukprot:gb/GECH01011633.1/.p1 GENE.gb/GECH01011633.1/~~gb/GECH01011633.1/.p1  ORF type:complete len:324 (+),score=66.31 gb/GECH01011633.1/:1-972(+)
MNQQQLMNTLAQYVDINTVRQYADVNNLQKEALSLYNKYSKDTETIGQVMFVIHALLIAIFTSRRYSGVNKRPSLFAGFVVMLISGLGGALFSALLSGEAPFFLANDFYLGTMLAVWLIINLPPFSLIYYIATFPPIMSVLLASEGVFLGEVICNTVETTIQRYPGTIIVPIILGTLSGCGGLITGQAIFRGLETEEGPSELAAQSMSVVGPFLAATIFTVSLVFGGHKIEIPPVGHPMVDDMDLEVRHVVMLWFVFYMELGLVLDTLNYLFGSPQKETPKSTSSTSKSEKKSEKERSSTEEVTPSPSPSKKKSSKSKKKSKN